MFKTVVRIQLAGTPFTVTEKHFADGSIEKVSSCRHQGRSAVFRREYTDSQGEKDLWYLPGTHVALLKKKSNISNGEQKVNEDFLSRWVTYEDEVLTKMLLAITKKKKDECDCEECRSQSQSQE